MKTILKDQRGSGAIQFILILFLLLAIVMMSLGPISLTFKRMTIEQAKMKGLDQMQIKGGLTREIEQGIIDYLKRFGFEESRINISGTLAPRNYGEEVTLEITYPDTYERFAIPGVLSISKVTESITYEAFGTTTSYYHDNN